MTQPQYIYLQQAPKPPRNGLGVTGLILGLVAIVLSLIPLVGIFLSWLPGLLAVIFGHLGFSNSKYIGRFRRTESMWGFILGYSSFVLPFIIVLFIAAVAGSSNS